MKLFHKELFEKESCSIDFIVLKKFYSDKEVSLKTTAMFMFLRKMSNYYNV
jgi:hypothetical protein